MKKAELINKWQEKAKWCFESMKMNEDNSEYKRELAAKIDVYNDVILDIKELEEPEQEKVVIPRFVADRIEEYREIRFGLSLIFTIDDQTEDDIDFSKWLSADSENCEKVARAWLDGYSVEKEKRYYVYDKATKSYLGYNAVRTQLNWWTSRLENESFTEQEIKSIDERYWAFAEEVTK